MSTIGVLTGLASEARLFRSAMAGGAVAPVIGCSGADEGRAHLACRRFQDDGVELLVSFGLAGGLAQGLEPGTLVIADGILLPDGRIAPTSPSHARALSGVAEAAGLPAVGGILAGVRMPITSTAQKRALGRCSNAVAADMESHVLADFALVRGLPLVAIRAIADPVEMDIPAGLLDLVAPGGRIRVVRSAYRLVRGTLPAWSMWRIYRCSRAAMISLQRLMRAGAAGALSNGGP